MLLCVLLGAGVTCGIMVVDKCLRGKLRWGALQKPVITYGYRSWLEYGAAFYFIRFRLVEDIKGYLWRNPRRTYGGKE